MKLKICFDCGATERAQLNSLACGNKLAQLFGREEKLFGRKCDVVGLVDLAVAIRKILVKLTQVRLDATRLVDNQHCIAEMIKHVRSAVFDDRNQPFPTGKCFAFVRESSSIAQRTVVTLVIQRSRPPRSRVENRPPSQRTRAWAGLQRFSCAVESCFPGRIRARNRLCRQRTRDEPAHLFRAAKHRRCRRALRTATAPTGSHACNPWPEFLDELFGRVIFIASQDAPDYR